MSAQESNEDPRRGVVDQVAAIAVEQLDAVCQAYRQAETPPKPSDRLKLASTAIRLAASVAVKHNCVTYINAPGSPPPVSAVTDDEAS